MFFFLPVGMNYRTERFPVVTISLIGINTLIYVVMLICAISTQGASNDWVMQYLWLIPAQPYWWTYLTHMFVHGGILHLAGNMLFLFLFGCCVEDLVGRGRFIGMYLAGGIIAAFAFILFSTDHFASDIPMGGASGAISACMGMYLFLRANAHIEFKYFVWFYFYIRAGEFELPAWVAITFWFLNDLVWMVVDLVAGHHGGGVAFGAHVGGLLAGCAMIGLPLLIARGQKKPEAIPALAAGSVRAQLLPAMAADAVAAPEPAGETPVIFIFAGGNQSGPFTLTQVQDMLRLGSIGPDALYWSEGMTDWQTVADLA